MQSPIGLSCLRSVVARAAPCGAVRGYTLIELLATLLVIALLIGLIVPAVQATRESSRRSACQNNLHQIGVALALHLDRDRSFPIGCIGCKFELSHHGTSPQPQRFIAWNVHLLPFLEHTSLWEELDLSLPSFAAKNRRAGASPIPEFLCPSVDDAQFRNPLGLWRGCAFTDYGGIYGVEGVGHGATDPLADQWLNDSSLGVMLYELPVAPKHITDGLSHTAVVAESVLRRRTETEWVNGKNVFAQEARTRLNQSSGLGNEVGSAHNGGAMILLGDGHVRFVSDAISPAALRALLTKAGAEVIPE